MPLRDLEEIKSRHPLESVIASLTNQQVEHHKIFCPFHANGRERTASLHVYDDGSWKCFGCGKSGRDVLDFVGVLLFGDRYDPHAHLPDVIDRLGEYNIAPVEPRTPLPPRPKPTDELDFSWAVIERWMDGMTDEHRQFIARRWGIPVDFQDIFNIGWDGQRLIIPVTYRNVILGIKQRRWYPEDDLSIDSNPNKYIWIGARSLKYTLFNRDAIWRVGEGEYLIISEGEWDALSLTINGFPAISSTGGSQTWLAEWSQGLAHLPNIAILYDNDEAGRKGALAVRRTLVRAKIIVLPDGVKDASEFFVKHPNDAPAWLAARLYER